MLLKYILFALIVGIILKFIPDLKMDDNQIIGVVLAATLIIFVVDNITRREGFDNFQPYPIEHVVPEVIPEISENSCDKPQFFPKQYTFKHKEEDYANTGLDYDTNEPKYPLLQQGQFEKVMKSEDIINAVRQQTQSTITPYTNGPGYYLANNGEYSETVPYEKADLLIKESKLEALRNQHNYNIIWSPHTHIGKARGYLNWDPNY